MSLNVLSSEAGEVSVGKGCRIPPSEDLRSEVHRLSRLSRLRASRATARLPWRGEARMRAMPAPPVGPAPMRIAKPAIAISMLWAEPSD